MKQKVGAKPKYQDVVETITLHRLVPKQKVEEIDQAIEKICEGLKTKK